MSQIPPQRGVRALTQKTEGTKETTRTRRANTRDQRVQDLLGDPRQGAKYPPRRDVKAHMRATDRNKCWESPHKAPMTLTKVGRAHTIKGPKSPKRAGRANTMDQRVQEGLGEPIQSENT